MRYSLKQLEKLVPIILSRGHVNTPLDGYPILHSVFIELRDEQDKTKHPNLVKLIKTILQHPECNPDVLDKHEKPLLVYAAENDKLDILDILIRANADPNFTSTKLQRTALEWTIQHCPSSKAIPILRKCTTVTQQLLATCQEMFDDALEEEDVDTINVLLDQRLATYRRRFRNNLNSSPNLPAGFWIRTIDDPKQELKTLVQREKLEDRVLAKQRHTKNPDPNSYYTNYSPATFVRHSIPISIFDFQDAGLMIRPSNDPIPYWFDGHREELTREFSYHKGAQLNNGQKNGQYWEVTPQQIQKIIEDLYRKEVNQCKKMAKEDESEEQHRFDKHGVLLDKMLCDISFSWNEGLMRYKHKQIFGISVNPENETSCKRAFILKDTLKLNVPFYDYRQYPGTTHELNPGDLIQKWNLDVPTTTTQKTAVKPLVMSNGHQLPKQKTATITIPQTHEKLGMNYGLK